jgi:bifunctional ADP-heptose synthase (sugar kinase/adenylyltransferase)
MPGQKAAGDALVGAVAAAAAAAAVVVVKTGTIGMLNARFSRL